MLAGCSFAVFCQHMFAIYAMLSPARLYYLALNMTLPRVRAALWSCYISKVQQMAQHVHACGTFNRQAGQQRHAVTIIL